MAVWFGDDDDIGDSDGNRYDVDCGEKETCLSW